MEEIHLVLRGLVVSRCRRRCKQAINSGAPLPTVSSCYDTRGQRDPVSSVSSDALLFGDSDPRMQRLWTGVSPAQRLPVYTLMSGNRTVQAETLMTRALLTLLNLPTAAPLRSLDSHSKSSHWADSLDKALGHSSSLLSLVPELIARMTQWVWSELLCVRWGQCFGKMELSEERLSVFLENVRQEMPKAHLEVLHIQEVHAWQPRPSALRPAHLVVHSFVPKFLCNN